MAKFWMLKTKRGNIKVKMLNICFQDGEKNLSEKEGKYFENDNYRTNEEKLGTHE